MGIVNQSACGAGLTKAGHLVPDNISATLAFTADLRSSHNRKSVRKNHSAYIAFMTVFRPIGQPVMRAHPAADGADAVRKRVKRLYLTANGTFPAECIFRFQDLCMLQLRITCSAPMVVHRNSIAVLGFMGTASALSSGIGPERRMARGIYTEMCKMQTGRFVGPLRPDRERGASND